MTPVTPTRGPTRTGSVIHGAPSADAPEAGPTATPPETRLPPSSLGLPATSRGSTDALRTPTCAATQGVSLRVHQDDGSRPATVATLPGNAFYCATGGATTLEGPRVRIRVDGDIKTAESNIPGLSQ
ncbi:MAG: hypothetical protein ACAI38_06995, partial [Myxococcota bacterium]